jgi:hypothetical protein
MTSQQFLVCDSSTLANFKQWAQAISGFFTTAGWSQSTDTGQVNWSTIASVPGSGAFIYEVWQPNDGLTNFFVKIEYGNVSGTNCPSLRLTLSTTTNGAGTPTGFVQGPWFTNPSSYTAPSATTQYECNFSGGSGRIGVMMWRNGINSCQQFFAIERSLNSSGAYTGTYATIWLCGVAGATVSPIQATLYFSVGSTYVGGQNIVAFSAAWRTRLGYYDTTRTTVFNGSIPFDTCSPQVGFFDWPCTVCGSAQGQDIVEGVPFSVTLYGSVRTYMPSKNGFFTNVGGWLGAPFAQALCMRYD